ncbi:MAG TPA: NnrU family protein [Pseudolabrys sp.]|nr:NnrU family protein [Pseudolabrys sp.]
MAALIYGALCYVAFLGSFLYFFGFVGNVAVPKSIDSGVAGSPTAALIVDAILLALFALQHSVMARPSFKRWWTRFVPASVERSTYVLMTSLVLILLYWQWRPLPGVIWSVTSPAGAAILMAVTLAGCAIVLVSTFLISHFSLFGLSQVYAHWRRQPAESPVFQTPSLYRFVRHPIYFGSLLALWAPSVMTAGHLLFAAAFTIYIFVGIWLEERDLVTSHGSAYVDYRKRVSMIVPLPPRS